MSNQFHRACLAILCALSLLTVQAIWAETRTALVIGNGNYQNTPPLPNSPNDAQDMAAALRRLSFTVLEGKDLNRTGMEELLDQFGKQAESADIAVVFYSGHGIQVDGRNYLIPVDAQLKEERDLRRLISLDTILAETGQAKRLGLVILDSCRDNPLARTLARGLGPARSAAVGRGLAVVQQTPPATLVAFATRENDVAADGNEKNSPFTTALLQYLEEPGLEVNMLFRKVRSVVLAKTNQRQEPFTYGSMPEDPIYLATAPDATTPVATAPPTIIALPAAAPKPATAVAPSPSKPSPPVLKPGQVFRDTLRDGSQGPEMVVIPAGEFWMGSAVNEEGRGDDERRHRVRIEKPFAIGKYEVTFNDAGGYRLLRGGSWLDVPQGARRAARIRGVAVGRSLNLGFRLARTPST